MADSDVARWLASLGLTRYAEPFTDHEIDWEVVPELTDADLEKVGIPLGSRKKLLKAGVFLQESADPTLLIPGVPWLRYTIRWHGPN